MTRILLADDDVHVRKLVRATLMAVGFQVTTVTDGREALTAARVNPPTLIITDVMMPKMDGWSLVRQLRGHKSTAFIPVIFLTALGDKEDRLKGFRLGADDYLTKPFDPEELTIRVDKLLRAQQSQQQSQRELLESVDMTGSLAIIGLSSLLIMLEMERKTGVLTLRNNGDVCELAVSEGTLIRGKIAGRPRMKDAECVYHALTWSDGRFEFSYQKVPGKTTIGESLTSLLMEGARRIDEENRDDAPPLTS